MSSGVEFDEDKLKYAPRSAGGFSGGGGYTPGAENQSRMARWLMAKGIVKSPSAANAVLITLVAINIVVTFIVITYFL